MNKYIKAQAVYELLHEKYNASYIPGLYVIEYKAGKLKYPFCFVSELRQSYAVYNGITGEMWEIEDKQAVRLRWMDNSFSHQEGSRRWIWVDNATFVIHDFNFCTERHKAVDIFLEHLKEKYCKKGYDVAPWQWRNAAFNVVPKLIDGEPCWKIQNGEKLKFIKVANKHKVYTRDRRDLKVKDIVPGQVFENEFQNFALHVETDGLKTKAEFKPV